MGDGNRGECIAADFGRVLGLSVGLAETDLGLGLGLALGSLTVTGGRFLRLGLELHWSLVTFELLRKPSA